ncbi:MAG: sulfatase [Rikenellaceae bacterium]
MKSLTLATSFVCAAVGLSAAAQEVARPNILWLTYEDTSAEFIGCYGNEMAKMPTIDKLASEGVRFTNAFSTGTVSSASRFCLITGCKPGKFGTGNHRSGYVIPEFVKGFPQYLKDAGYYTTNNYKTDYNHHQHRKMAADSWNECSGKATWRNRAAGQPFFAVYNSNFSHQSKTMTNPWDLYVKQILSGLKPENTLPVDAPFEMPPFYRDSPDMRKDVSRVYNSIARTDQEMGGILQLLEEDGLKDSTIIFCFSDHGEGIPRAKGSALSSGHRVPFVLYIPEMYSDLSPWGSGVVTDELVSFEDMSATVLALAGIKLPEYHEGVPFLPKANLEGREQKKEYVFGQCDRVDDNFDLARTVTDGRYMYSRTFTPYQPFVRWINYYEPADIQIHMRADLAAGVLNDCQKEIVTERSVEYLYDLKNDKWEINNLAESPKHKSIVKKMRKALKEHLLESRDANFMPEYTLAEYFKKETPYDLRLDDEFYPFEEILETAYLNGMGKKVIGKQIKQLKADNGFVSFWAAVGLYTQRDNLKADVDKVVEALPLLEYLPAKIWAAAAVLNVVENEYARDVFSKSLTSDNSEEALCAFNALNEMELERAKSFVPLFGQIENAKVKHPAVMGILAVAKCRLEGVPVHHANYW